MDLRVRFAPSPTGQVHIGNIRTAIFNWLFARHNGGEFLVRIEDTDLERSTKEAIDKMFECLEWLKIDYDGEVMYQSKRCGDHMKAVEQLEAAGDAYRPPVEEGTNAPIIFRIPWNTENIAAVRDVGPAEFEVHPEEPVEIKNTGINCAQVSKKNKPVPFAACLAGFRQMKVFNAAGDCVFCLEDNIDKVLAGENFSFENCSRITFLRKEVFFKDIIKGELAKPLDSIKDLIIVRSDGSPVFHIANVCDDIAQNITHIVRGDDHVENTYRHILLFHALGAEVPQYAHMPMIVNSAGKPYSKRDGDAFVGDFKDKGILSDALFNYLALLGWSPGDDREKMTREEMIEAFLLERVKSAPAQLDMNKLINMNGMYMSEIPFEQFADKAWSEYCSVCGSVERDDFNRVAALMQSRTRTFAQVAEWKYFFADDFERNDKAFRKAFKKDENRNGLEILAAEFAALGTFDAESITGALGKVEQACQVGPGSLNQPLRLAVTGTNSGPDILDTLTVIGQVKCVSRIKDALEYYEATAEDA
jgi:glutamyl-tRNA synthetase